MQKGWHSESKRHSIAKKYGKASSKSTAISPMSSSSKESLTSFVYNQYGDLSLTGKQSNALKEFDEVINDPLSGFSEEELRELHIDAFHDKERTDKLSFDSIQFELNNLMLRSKLELMGGSAYQDIWYKEWSIADLKKLLLRPEDFMGEHREIRGVISRKKKK